MCGRLFCVGVGGMGYFEGGIMCTVGTPMGCAMKFKCRNVRCFGKKYYLCAPYKQTYTNKQL